MRPESLFLRCFAERRHNQWQAFCIDLNLAAQGDSLEEVERKLEAMIAEYVYDALAGEDREYAAPLMRRKAPLSLRWRYHLYSFCARFSHWRSDLSRTFQEQIPPLSLGSSPQSYKTRLMGWRWRPLDCREVKRILKNLGFKPRPRKGTSHEQWVKDSGGARHKVTVDCPKAPFSPDLIKSMAAQRP